MIFNCFPRKQSIYLVYSSYNAFRSEMFRNFYIQVSPKDSLFYRLSKTDFGFIINSFLSYKINVPCEDSDYVGIIKNEVIILVEIINSVPVKVWRKDDKDNWICQPFLGFQLISEYSIKEFNRKQKLIEKALALQWMKVNESNFNIHGDFTHFNILINHNEINFIDQKSNNHSKLYDFFYFYSYLSKCIYRKVTLSDIEKKQLVEIIENIIKKICVYSSKESLDKDFNEMNTEIHTAAITTEEIEKFKSKFYNLFV